MLEPRRAVAALIRVKGRLDAAYAGPHRGLRPLALLVAVAVTAAFLSAVVSAQSDVDPTAARPPALAAAPATVALLPGAQTRPIPASFLGISTEYWALPQWERHAYLLQRALSLVHVPGQGPLILRIGGDSADEALWSPRSRKIADWVIELTPQWLSQTRALVSGTHARLILDLNTVTATPEIAAAWAHAADDALPSGSIAGYEIGNEPDLYDRPYWMSVVAGSSPSISSLPREVSARGYVHDFRVYAHTLAEIAPGAPLLGPAVAHPRTSLHWTEDLLRGAHAGLRVVTAHTYPYSACSLPGTSSYPTIRRLLSERAVTRVTAAVRSTLMAAHRAGLPFRLSELNSVTCQGRRGVSNAFATALWAPDTLFSLVREGVNAVNIHVRPHTSNAAFSISDSGLQAHPLLYGMLLFVRAVTGKDPRLQPLAVHVSRRVDLKAWAVRVSGGLHIVLIDKSSRPVRVALRVPAAAAASVERLTAPSAAATSGETLAGQRLGANGGWLGRRVSDAVRRGRHGLSVLVPPTSAALVSIPLRPGA